MQTFSGRWTLITGASSGLGEEFARQLAARKSNLILTARSGGKLEALAAELTQAHGVETRVLAQDLGAPGGAAQLCDAVERLGLPVEHLVSNAGFGTHGALAEADAGREADEVRLNCEALVYVSARLVRQMVARGSGGIIHLASVAGYQPVPFMATYGATKAFVLSFSQALSEEVRGSGVVVTALCPGPVRTGFQQAAGMDINPSQRRAELSAAETVRLGLAAFDAGKRVCVPGGYNKMGTFMAWISPTGIVTRTVGKMMRNRPKLPTVTPTTKTG